MVARRTVRGEYMSGLRPNTGTIEFTPSSEWQAPAIDVVMSTAPIVARLIQGKFAIDLWTTDDPDVLPATGRYYRVVENLADGSGRTFNLVLPAAETALSLADYLPVDPGEEPGPPNYLSLALTDLVDVSVAQLGEPEAGKYQPVGQDAIAAAIEAHRLDPTPHPAYDDIPDLVLIFENGLI